ncbi:hypothetical protein AUP68_08352 [Ilyonectria robusta]
MPPELVSTGNAQKRFVQITTLLSLIDPVRGEPITHTLDRHPHDGRQTRERLQKKFLDSFALICSTSSKGGETASAVCLENSHPSGTIIRLARNLGVPEGLTGSLQAILDDLAAVASKESSIANKEPEILQKIIILNRDKIQCLLERLQTPEIRDTIREKITETKLRDLSINAAGAGEFVHWIENLPLLAASNLDINPESLIFHLTWASEAKWVYSRHLEEVFCNEGDDLPPWITIIYKLGKFAVAAKNMLQMAIKQPEVFSSIHIEVIEAPQQQPFSLKDEQLPLLGVVRRLTGGAHDDHIARLGQFWLTADPETRFRRACRLILTVHAEMQLLAFYDHNPQLTPSLLFIGTSKKSCFLCHQFLSRHPLAMSVSSCHQKLYPSWTPAPCSNASVYSRHKMLIRDLSRQLEETTARDLAMRLDIRRPAVLDSSAGPSLPGPGSLDMPDDGEGALIHA